jgi:hypothetical protein
MHYLSNDVSRSKQRSSQYQNYLSKGSHLTLAEIPDSLYSGIAAFLRNQSVLLVAREQRTNKSSKSTVFNKTKLYSRPQDGSMNWVRNLRQANAPQRVPGAGRRLGLPLPATAGGVVGGGGQPAAAADTIDPWAFYGGNIAAACLATNDAVVERERGTEGNEEQQQDGKTEENRRQRTNRRLTAWQSRERKRIEIKVLQERQSELKGRNEELNRENEQLKLVIKAARKRIGANNPLTPAPVDMPTSATTTATFNSPTMSGATRTTPTLTTSMAAKRLTRMQPTTENLPFPYHGLAPPPGRDLPTLSGPSRTPDYPSFLFEQPRTNIFQGENFLRRTGMLGLTRFAPLIRGSQPQHHQQSLPAARAGQGCFILASTMAAPPQQKVDIPLFRAITKMPSKRKGLDDHALSSNKKSPARRKKSELSSSLSTK